LCGLAIGDSFGDAARKPDNQRDFGITTDFNKGASWSTDDTEFALLTVEMLINCGGNLKVGNVIDSWMKHVATEDELRRGGSSEVEAATNLRRGIMPPYSGEYNSYFCSDGAAMRSGPIGIMCAGDPERAAEIAAIDASISHYRDGIWGAQAVAVAVSLAMVDAEIDEILMGFWKWYPRIRGFMQLCCELSKLWTMPRVIFIRHGCHCITTCSLHTALLCRRLFLRLSGF